MTKKKQATIIVLALVFVGICVFAGFQFKDGSSPVGTAWSLFPPLVAIVLALLTKEVYSSLFIGIVTGGILANINLGAAEKFTLSPMGTVSSVVSDGLISAVAGQAGIFLFLVLLGVVVALLNKAGAARAFGAWATKHAKGKIGAAVATFIFGVLIFIDDYFNCLTVGAVMRPVTDKAGISRAKLAYLIDATAAPVCMIAPISSWAAAVSGYAPEGQGLSLFIQAIPYNFYSLLTFVFILGITFMNFDFGPMKLHEANAKKGDLFSGYAEVGEAEETGAGGSKGKVIDLILPILFLIGVCVFALFYVGRCMGADWVFASSQYDASLGFVDAFSNTDATVGLPLGGLVALLGVIIYFVARKLVTMKEAMDCIAKGFNAMVPAILILTMATALKNMTGLLSSDTFVQNALADAAALQKFLPAIIFLVACFIAFATGTSWGTFGILIPIVLAIFPLGSSLSVIGMSACLAGAVCGDHCSPISDTTIMSSAGARCNHIVHVSTQLPYAITVAVISFITYVVAGFVQTVWVSLPLGIVLTLGTLFVLKALQKKTA